MASTHFSILNDSPPLWLSLIFSPPLLSAIENGDTREGKKKRSIHCACGSLQKRREKDLPLVHPAPSPGEFVDPPPAPIDLSSLRPSIHPASEQGAPSTYTPMVTSDEDAKKVYADFEKKVKRTIYIDHLSPQVTSSVIKAALAQCANVVDVEFIVNYTIPYDIPSAALVELDDEIQAKAALDLMNDFPFIIGGMPRPVRATCAKPEMFRERPPRPGIKKEFRWVKQEDGTEYEGMKKLRILAKRQEVENMALIKNQLEEEKELAKQQQELLDGNYKKYDMLENVIQNGNMKSLAQHYGVSLADEF